MTAENLWQLVGEQYQSGLLGGLTISEDNKGLRLSALAPRLDPKTLKVKFRRGFLDIRARVKV